MCIRDRHNVWPGEVSFCAWFFGRTYRADQDGEGILGTSEARPKMTEPTKPGHKKKSGSKKRNNSIILYCFASEPPGLCYVKYYQRCLSYFCFIPASALLAPEPRRRRCDSLTLFIEIIFSEHLFDKHILVWNVIKKESVFRRFNHLVINLIFPN